uniref:BTB/POZ domain-containing protein KCTD12-like n=1 Tax=Diabrotica virgifera virgifera TaxID=50390 RepID=A0A6P7FSN1_DIAVI
MTTSTSNTPNTPKNTYSNVVNTFKHPTEDQAVVLSSIEGIKIHHYIVAIGSLVGPRPRILICGKVDLCRSVFGETLNESRDPDHGQSERYTSRFFLKHFFLEQAFDMLLEQGFKLSGSCGSGTAGGTGEKDLKPGVDAEENRWNHYNEFVFVRD